MHIEIHTITEADKYERRYKCVCVHLAATEIDV